MYKIFLKFFLLMFILLAQITQVSLAAKEETLGTLDLLYIQGKARMGDKDAQLRLGEIYLIGNGVDKNENTAFSWMEKSADQGNVDAQFLLGRMYFEAKGENKNYNKAISWYVKAANNGHIEAAYALGLYYDGIWDKKRRKKIKDMDVRQKFIKWYTISAKQGHADSQYQLAKKYLHGWWGGTGKDDGKVGIEWMISAAEQGHKEAISDLAIPGYLPRGEGIKWLKIASNNGDISAQHNLGLEYYAGEYVRQDNTLSKKWLGISCDNGQRLACEAYRQLKSAGKFGSN